MNRIVYCCLAAVALFILASCASFRINMTQGFGPHTPPTPAPSGLATEWVDVGNWQSFLVSIHFLTVGKFEVNKFDLATEKATRKFQKWKGPHSAGEPLPVLPDIGCVNFATYSKALREGMPAYTKVLTPPCQPPGQLRMMAHGHHPMMDGHHRMMEHGQMQTLTVGDHFRQDLRLNDNDTTPNDPTTHKPYNDVCDWQTFLAVDMGYLDPHKYPNNPCVFDNPTRTATQQFQHDTGVTGDTTGWVGKNTFNKAESAACGMDSYTLVPHN